MVGFGEADAEVGAAVKLRALVMFDAQRMTLYATIAGMVEAGIDIREAAEIVAEEFEAADDPKAAKSVTVFFAGLEAAKASGRGAVRDLAKAAFGEKFVCPEEMALLTSLVAAPKPERILEAASRLLELQNRTRAAAVVGSQQRFVG